MNEAREKQDEISQKGTKNRKREGSPLPQSSKQIKVDVKGNVNNTSLDLSTNSNEQKEASNVEVHSDNTTLVAGHYNSLQNKLSVRDKSRILYMRNFNNWIKSMLMFKYINENHKGLKVLDMCCGKGGDLFKWLKMNITHLICTDVAEITMQHCQERYNDMVKRNQKKRCRIFTAEFIIADCTRVRLRKQFQDPSISFDLVSCQFAFHYCFESLEQAECMMKNASECLKPGGYFIGTIPNAYDLVSRWQQCDGNRFGNEIYSIEFFCDKKKPPLFGAKYHFRLDGVVDCPEFLVYLPVFRKLALKFGLELVLFERFEDFYEHKKDEGNLLLRKIQALETYSPYDEKSLVGKADKDYQHAKQYLQNSSNCRKIGTLSQPEWEVTSLYAVFAFKKMKT